MSGLFKAEVLEYLEDLESQRDLLLEEMYCYAAKHGQPVLDRVSARFLRVLVAALRPLLAVEIGCNIGVSALHIARAMPEGKLITIDTDPDIVELANEYFRRAGVAERVDARVGTGLERLEEIPQESVDLAFIDADKEGYPDYLDALYPLLKTGGVLAADNLLWDGRVVDAETEEPSTRALIRFNRRLMNHEGFRATVLPIGDGIGFAVKRG